MSTTSIQSSHPILAREWHPTKNAGLDLASINANSRQRVWWQCQVNHEHQWPASVRRRAVDGTGCPYCGGRRLDPAKSLARMRPDLLAEWHFEKNPGLDPKTVSVWSKKRVWWKCNQGHEWPAPTLFRARDGQLCPQCRQSAKTLNVTHPQLIRFWHPSKNGDLRPDMVSRGENRRIWWRCPQGHEWEAPIITFSRQGGRCARCARDSNRQHRPNLIEHAPELAREWDAALNGALTPETIPYNSSIRVAWICSKDPTHRWPTSVRNRSIQHSGCPFCKKTVVASETSLAMCFPQLAAEWCAEKNGNARPDQFLPGSQQKVWWKCAKEPTHVWPASIASRTRGGRPHGCPFCFGARVSPEKSLAVAHPDIASEWHPKRNGSLKPSDVTRASGRKVWWLCKANPQHEWPSQVKNRVVLGTGCPQCAKEMTGLKIMESLWAADQSYAADTRDLFLAALETIDKLARIGKVSGRQLVQAQRRLHYASVITALEAYLCDTFRAVVLSSDEQLRRFLQATPEFCEKKWALTDILDWERNMRTRVSEYLFQVLWHNLPRVRHMFRETLGVTLPDDIEGLMQAVSMRHDIVHRNGRRKDGRPILLRPSAVADVIKIAKALVSHVHGQLISRKLLPESETSMRTLRREQAH